MKKLPSRCEALGLDENWIDDSLRLLPFEVDKNQREALLYYVQLLQQWNDHFNLTAITGSQEVWIKHILDSLSVLPYLELKHREDQCYIDVGTGAGLPGVPLAIMRPQWRWRLIDSNAKKIRFLQQVRLMLPLPSVIAEHQRTETLLRDDLPVVVICRAYAPPERITEQVRAWFRDGEAIYLLQGQNLTTLIPPCGYVTDLYEALSVPQLNASRHLWVLIKQR